MSQANEQTQNNPQPQEAPEVSLPTDIQNIGGFIGNLDTTPSHKPGKFWDSIKIALGSLYIFDRKNDKWLIAGGQYASGFGSKSAGGGTGDEAITVGFKPKMIKITAYPSGNNTTLSIGTRYATYTKCLYKYKNGSGNYVGATDSNYLVIIWDDALANNTEVSFVSFDDNGFTINWYTDDVSIVYLWEAFA